MGIPWNGPVARAARAAALLVGLAVMTSSVAGQAPAEEALRERITAQFEVVPLSAGVGLVPREETAGVRLVELTDGTVAIDGRVVTGQELRDRLGDAADAVIQLSFLDPAARRSLLGIADEGEPTPETPPEPDRPAPPDRPAAPATPERTAPSEPPAPPRAPAPPSRRRSSRGDEVRIFRSAAVGVDEIVRGDVVAVLGSARIDGEVTGDVVAVLGGVRLGPEARIDGDVTSVGGVVDRAPGSVVRGGVHEVAFAPAFDPDVMRDWGWWHAGGQFWPFTPLFRAGRLVGTLFRLALLGLVASLVLLVAPRPVERIAFRARTEPVKAGLVGFLVQVLFVPLLVLTCVILAISIIGIPLLLLVPFALVALVAVLVAGFTGVAYLVGDWVRERFGWDLSSPYVRVWVGVAAILTPLIVARVLGMAGGLFNAFAVVIIALAVLLEYAAWTAGLGAAIVQSFGARRAELPPEPPPGPVVEPPA